MREKMTAEQIKERNDFAYALEVVATLADKVPSDGWDIPKRHIYGKKVFDEEFAGMKVLNCGFGGDRVETLHWRLANGELDGYTTDFYAIGNGNRPGVMDVDWLRISE